jgi:hypothetical protein
MESHTRFLRPYSALSLKQPWATLLTHGRKTVEIRSSRPSRQGLILIHAARIPDEREEVWRLVPAELRQDAQRTGGIVGFGYLDRNYKTYRSREEFAQDQPLHWNDPSWFEGPSLYGFVFTRLKPLEAFHLCRGQTRFFSVHLPNLLICEPPEKSRWNS